MALIINSSIRLLPRAPDSKSSSSIKASQISLNENLNNRSWRNRCVLGLTSLILAFELGDFFISNETRALESPPPHELVDSRRVKISRWSDERKCPPWRSNSLEIIVPENLPRISYRRNWENVSNIEKNAPMVQVISVKPTSNSKFCFSL